MQSNRSRVALPQLDGLVVLERRRRDDVLCGVAGRAQHHVRVPCHTQQTLIYLILFVVEKVVGPGESINTVT